MVDATEIKQLQKTIGSASWKLDLWKFADAVGSNADHDYTKDKFREFQALSKALNGFDSETLAKIINAAGE
jgi:hypothetical protein